MKHTRIAVNSPDEHSTIGRATLLCLILAVLDQITKDYIISTIKLGTKKQVIPGFFDLTYVTNPGAAWGIFSNMGILLLSIAITAVIVILVFLRYLCEGWRERYYALFLVISGILGNSYDRLCRSSYGKLCDGEVVDFLSFHIGDIPWAVWPSFNVADICICVGTGLFALSYYIRPEKEKNDGKEKTA